MKKLLILLAIAAVVFSFHSCRKGSDFQPAQNNDETISRSQKVIALIGNFKNKMENNLKSGEMITTDSAVWYMEATLNYGYAHPDSLTAEYFTQKSFFTLSVDGSNMVSMDEVQTVYNQMEDTLLAQFGGIANSYKVISFSDVSLDSVVGGTGYMSVTNGFGVDPPRNYVPFDENDDWIWGTLNEDENPPAGKCDGTEYGISDGSDELQWRLNNPMPVPQEQIFYTDLVTRLADGILFTDPNTSSPRLYVGWNYPEDNCLTNDTLTYYLNQSDDIIYTYDYNGGLRPSGKDFVRVKIIDDVYPWGWDAVHIHAYWVTYGIPSQAPPDN